MVALIVLLPPWRIPWFEENVILLQLRWIIMVLLFGLQCVESLFSMESVDGGGDRLNDIFFLRIGWVPVVQTIMLTFCAVPIVYFFYIILRIFANTRMRDPFDPQSKPVFTDTDLAPHNYGYHSMVNYDSIYDQNYGDRFQKKTISNPSISYGLWDDFASK